MNTTIIAMSESKPTQSGVYDVIFSDGKPGKGLWCMKNEGHWQTLRGAKVTHYVPQKKRVTMKDLNATGTRKNNSVGSIPLVDILNVVSEYYGVHVDNVLSKVRLSTYVTPRHVCLYLQRHFGWSHWRCGDIFDLDHSSVVNAERRIDRLIKQGGVIKDDVEYLTAVLSNNVKKTA